MFDSELDAATNVDVITGFSSIDMIHLDMLIFGAVGTTLDAAEFRTIATGTTLESVDSTDRIVHLQSTGELFYDADGNGAQEAVLFARVNAGVVLNVDDFLMI